MGGHSSPERGAFYRSVVTWFLPWMLIAGVVAIGVWVAVDAVSDEGFEAPPAATTPDPEASPSERVTTPAPPTTDAPSAAPTTPALITEGISVQVLNGTGVAGGHDPLTARLVDLGFQVVTVAEASRVYELTTVFWSTPEDESAAAALAAHFGWNVAEKPPNLSSEVSIHVVVGADEAG